MFKTITSDDVELLNDICVGVSSTVNGLFQTNVDNYSMSKLFLVSFEVFNAKELRFLFYFLFFFLIIHPGRVLVLIAHFVIRT